MPAVFSAPRPRLARPELPKVSPHQQPGTALFAELPQKPKAPMHPAASTSRLMSPIELAPPLSSHPHASCPSSPRFQIPRSPTPRRRSKPYASSSSSSHTRRRSSRVPEHPFDRLPWISALDAPPTRLDLCDIADLSQLPIPPATPSCTISPSPRRLRSHSRSNQLFPPPSLHRPHTPLRDTQPPVPPPPASSDISRPHTPRPRFAHSRVLFHHLMPVLCDSRADDPDRCTFTPPLSMLHH
ncbi:hypothetical protein H0H81_000645 [Sphagnurus paluster]|uniref:Uncharacterized protein n=1 Tax=Sphagnurus paluster TaxID=117069 RepID=A0A9P7FYA4_9AGAR|nr:hypothetical protein H0H81_000645 [Sphagnurus paluster]